MLVSLHVARVDFDEEVEVAAGVVALGNLFDVLNGIHELLDELLSVLLQSDVAHDDDAVAQFFGVDDRHVSLDVALAFQPFLPLEGGRGREVYGGGQFLYREVRVALEQSEYFQVGVVELFFCFHSC